MKNHLKKLWYLAGPVIIFLLINSGLKDAKDFAPLLDSTLPTESEVSSVTQTQTPSPIDSTQSDKAQGYKVTRVVDGDTIKVMIGSNEQTVRVIGINTPETVDPRKAVECFGHEASGYAKSLLTGQEVALTVDPTQDETDKYRRLLRYVTLADGRDYGDIMIRSGYAYEYTYQVPYEKQSIYKSAQAEAKLKQAGLWSPETCNGKKKI